MSKSTFAKTKAQIKSYQYYIFWGACTAAVMAGQIFVGVGYRSMSQEVKDLTEMIQIQIELEELRKEKYGGIIY
jgi:formate/nitrite transporter FocA (FNT family)|tara:strand:- start:40 stop:261 length:222 start_codon:yes stop_codon:yes gene_type:complete